MKKLLLAFIMILGSFSGFSQIRYSGFIDKYPIEFVADVSENYGDAVYAYKKFNTPIYLDAKIQKGVVTFSEKDGNGKETATLTFKNNDANFLLSKGIWKDLKTGKEFEISLTKEFDFKVGNHSQWKNQELLQSVSTKNHYFKLVTQKQKEDYYPRVSAIRIYNKKTNALFQEFTFDGELRGLNSIQKDDYNFDGIEDFSVFEASYAGPNTSSLYYLFDPKTQKYFESSFSGISLSFDAKTKTISERNQCCAGTIVTEAKYKLKNNQMVLLEEHCYKWDEKKGELVERKMQDCK